jgi:hypothetical protein
MPHVRLGRVSDKINAARAAMVECARFAIVDPDPSHLSAVQLDHQIDLVSGTLNDYRRMAISQYEVNDEFPAFTPVPSAAEFDVIGHHLHRTRPWRL